MDSNLKGTTYLLHFIEPIGHSRHYLGWTNDMAKRMREHLNGSRQRCVLTDEAKQRGIKWTLARVWEDVTIEHEKKLKRQKNGPRLCPICNPGVLKNDNQHSRNVGLREEHDSIQPDGEVPQ